MNFFISKCIIGILTISCLMYLTNTTKIYPQQIHDFNPIRNLPPPPLSQRRQGYGYSASIVHYTPGDPNAQHAQSEINVNMNLNNEVRQPKITNNEISSNKKSHYHSNSQSSSPKSIKSNTFESTKPLFHSQLPNQMQIQPQKGVLHINEPKPKSPQQVSTSLGQNSFNVGYSIGFGTQSDTPTSNIVQPPAGFIELQKFTPDVVKGTANDKVLKPAAFQSEMKPKDYVLSAVETYQKQGIQMPFAKSSPKKVDETNYNQYKYQQYGSDDILTSSNQQTSIGYVPKSSKKLSSKPKNVESTIYTKQNNDFGWKSLSPTLEVASGITNLNSAHNINPLTVSSKHSTNGHTLVNSQSSTQTHFDHAQALGHSQGFDYSNAINFENNLSPAVSNHHEQQTASAVSSLIQQSTPLPILPHQQVQQSGRSSSGADSNFAYQQQYQPVSLSWFNNQDAITTATTKDQLVLNNQPKPTPESVQIQSNNGLSNQYSTNPLPIDTRLLQPVPYLTTNSNQQPSSNGLPIYFDTSLLQKAIISNGNGQIRLGLGDNPSQPNSVYALPASSNPGKPNSPPVQHQKSEVIFNSRPNPNEYHQQHHDNYKVIRQEKPENKRQYYHNHQSHLQEQRTNVPDRGQTQQQQINHRLYQNQPSSSSSMVISSVASPNGGDQHGSHSTQVNSVISPVEQVIKGKHKKPGVVRHPRVLNNNNDNNNDNDDEIITKSPLSGSPTVHHQINARNSNVGHSKYHVNTALRPPPMNFIIKKFSS